MRAALLAGGAVLCCCTAMAVQPAGLQAKGAGLSRAERKVVKVVNGIRASHGLRRLRASRALTRAAGAHTGDILRTSIFSHSSSDGTPMAARLRGYTGAAWLGENIAWVTLRRGVARAVVRMWMASPGHRAVLLASAARRIGVGKRTGRMGGAKVAVVTADFASRH